MMGSARNEEIFAISVEDRVLLHAPLHRVTALVDQTGAAQIAAGLASNNPASNREIQSIVEWLRDKPDPAPVERSGPIDQPLFLGLIPTRGCNLGCRYCDFPADDSNEKMKLELARDAVDAYLDLILQSGKAECEIHFFGGEPFFAPAVVQFVVEHARMRAAHSGISLHLEATTNGYYPANVAEWIADCFDTIVLSLDGPADFHDIQRMTKNQRPTFEVVFENARIFSGSQIELCIRTCVTSKIASALPEIAEWFSQELQPATVCFETLTPSPQTEKAGLIPPDPWEFAREFLAAEKVLAGYGLNAVNSMTEIQSLQISCCPVGKDALIVAPNGRVDACYLLPESWEQRGLDMNLGQIRVKGDVPILELEETSVRRARGLNVNNKLRCAECVCRYHCAGGCHVNHPGDAPTGQFDELCIQTRIITIARLLKGLGQHDLASKWLGSRRAMEASVFQQSDFLSGETL
jgi:uncharacterized protein